MIHLLGLSLAQQSLIAIGTLFQVGAYGIFSRQVAEARMAEAAQKEREEAEAEAARREEAARAMPAQNPLPKVVRYKKHVEGVMEHVPDDIRPADLLRTAKVQFKNTLREYQGATQSMPRVRR